LGRSSIAVSDEVASELSKAASKSGKTSYALANECLGQALKICSEGGEPDEIYGDWKMTKIGREVGSLQWIGRDLVEETVHEIALVEPQKLVRIWHKAGYNFGIYLQICFPEIKDVVTLVNQLQKSFTIGRVKFVEQNSPVVQEGQSYTLGIVAANSAEFLHYLAEFWRGLLSAYGLEVIDSKVTSGALKIDFMLRGKLLALSPQVLK